MAKGNPTIYSLIEDEYMPERDTRGKTKRGRVRQGTPKIVADLAPVPFENRVGYRVVQPEELLSLRIPLVGREDGEIEGYQRPLRMSHAINIAWAMQDGREIENIQITLDEQGDAYCTDGQHRAIGAIINRKPLDAVIKQRSYAQARQLFNDQYLAKKPSQSHLVLTGIDRMARYVQDALVHKDHPWHDLVHESSKHKLGPATMHRLVTMYGCDAIGSHTPERIRTLQTRFNMNRADSLAEMIGAFGRDPDGTFSRENNHMAFKATNLSALTQAAVHIFLRADDVHPGEDMERWMRHMVGFNWVKYAYVKDVKNMTEQLLDHWNKKKTARRVERVVYHRLD